MELNVDPDTMEEFSPEKIAQVIFSCDPKAPCTNQMLALQEGADASFLFEILITIFMEGFELLTNGFEGLDMSKFTTEHIYALDPWINSLGFRLNVETFEKKDKESYKDYYCKIMIRTKLYETYFIMRECSKKYHFMLNGLTLEENKKKTDLKELNAVFINEDTETAFMINFLPYTL